MVDKRAKKAKRRPTPARSKARPIASKPRAQTSSSPKAPTTTSNLPPGTAWLVSPTFLFVSLFGAVGLFVGAVLGGSGPGAAVWGSLCVLIGIMLLVAVRRAGQG